MWGFKEFKEFRRCKASLICQNFARLFKDSVLGISIHLASNIDLAIKLFVFPSECKLAKTKPLFEKGTRTEANNFRPVILLPLITIIFKEMNCCTFTRLSDYKWNPELCTLLHSIKL